MPEKRHVISLKNLVSEAVTHVLEGKRNPNYIGVAFQGNSEETIIPAAREITVKLSQSSPPVHAHFDNLSHDGMYKGIDYYRDMIRKFPLRCFLIYDPGRKLARSTKEIYFIDLDRFDFGLY